MRLNQILEADHKRVIPLMKDLQAATRQLRQKGDMEAASVVIEKFLEAWETEIQLHFLQEEEALFPVLGRVTRIEGGPFQVMLEEHSTIREAVANLQREYRADPRRPDQVARWCGVISGTLHDHAVKEDEMLLPTAEKLLSREQKEEVERLLEDMGT